jgi:hypothetical protein
MKKQKIGMIIFVIAILLAVVMGGIASWSVASAARNLTGEEMAATIWTTSGFLFFFWAFAVPAAALLAFIGIMIYVRARPKCIWMSSMVIFLIFVVTTMQMTRSHYPPLFGIGGILILLSFFTILWFWAKRYSLLKGHARNAANLQLVGYVFLLIAMWFTCGALSTPFQKAFMDDPPNSPLHIMIYLVVGWIFLAISHFKLAKAKK